MGLESGPVAVIRNAGGRAMDAMRSIQVLNAINNLGVIVVVHHTGKTKFLIPREGREGCSHLLDCGTTHVKDSEVKEVIKKTGTNIPASDIDAMNFGEINEYGLACPS